MLTNTFQSNQTFVKSFASPSTDSNDNRIDLEPFLDGIGEIFSFEYSQQILQSLAFIAGYSVHKFLRIHSCQMCTDVLTFDKEYPLEFDSDSQFKLLEFTDRGELKYPSEPVLSCAIILWRILVSIALTSYTIQNSSESARDFTRLLEFFVHKIEIVRDDSTIGINLVFNLSDTSCPLKWRYNFDKIFQRVQFIRG